MCSSYSTPTMKVREELLHFTRYSQDMSVLAVKVFLGKESC